MVDLRFKKGLFPPPSSQSLIQLPRNGKQPSQLEATFLGLFPEIRAHLAERQESGSGQACLHFPILLLPYPHVPAGSAGAFPCLTHSQ